MARKIWIKRDLKLVKIFCSLKINKDITSQKEILMNYSNKVLLALYHQIPWKCRWHSNCRRANNYWTNNQISSFQFQIKLIQKLSTNLLLTIIKSHCQMSFSRPNPAKAWINPFQAFKHVCQIPNRVLQVMGKKVARSNQTAPDIIINTRNKNKRLLEIHFLASNKLNL